MDDRLIDEIREIGQKVNELLHRPIPNTDPESDEWLDVFKRAEEISFKVSLEDVKNLAVIYPNDLIMVFGIHGVFLGLIKPEPQIKGLPIAGWIGNN